MSTWADLLRTASPSRIVDLTMTLEDGQRGVLFEQAKTLETHGWNARTMHLYSHAGTHLDAPLHFGASEKTVDQIALTSCMGMAHVVDVSGIAPKALIEVAHLGSVAEACGENDSVLLRTDWSKQAGNPQYYRDAFPRVSDELAHWCAERKLRMLGVEPPSVADVNEREELTRIHRILLGADIVIVESLTNLDQLRSDVVFFAALPLKVGGGDGTPCRAFAIEGEAT